MKDEFLGKGLRKNILQVRYVDHRRVVLLVEGVREVLLHLLSLGLRDVVSLHKLADRRHFLNKVFGDVAFTSLHGNAGDETKGQSKEYVSRVNHNNEEDPLRVRDRVHVSIPNGCNHVEHQVVAEKVFFAQCLLL